MTEFKNSLNKFREMGQSIDVLFSEIERFIKHDKVNPTLLLEELTHQDIKNSLSPKDIDTLKERIVAVASLVEAKNNDLIQIDDTVELNQCDSTIELDNTDNAKNLYDSQTEVINEDLLASSSRKIPQSLKIKDSTDVDAELRSQARADRAEYEGYTLNDRYILEKSLGSGGMGVVYRAIDQNRLKSGVNDPYVAIKILRHGMVSSQNLYPRLQQEVKRFQKFDHPNIVEIYEVNRDQDIVYLVMEYLRGKTLREKIRASEFQGLPLQEALPFIHGMSEALAFAHNHGIVHYDFKPNNVIITDDGQIKVIDFGIARVYKGEVLDDRSHSDSMVLTPVYASPEMLEQQPPDPRDDIFALGITVYELLTGNHPFGHKRATQVRNTGLELRQPEGLERLQWEALKKTLSFERSDRTLTVKDFLEGLHVDRRSKKLNIPLLKGMVAATVVAIMAASLYLIAEDNGIQDHFDSLVNSTGLGVKDTARDRPQAAIVDKLGNTQTDVPESKVSMYSNQSMFASLREQQAIEQISRTAQGPISPETGSANSPPERVNTYVPQDSDNTVIKPNEVPLPPLLPKRQAKAETKSESLSRAVEHRWVVQVGSFRMKNNAVALRNKLKAAGYHVIEEKGETRNIPVYRVKVGPVEKRKRATILLAKLRREQKLDGYVTHFP